MTDAKRVTRRGFIGLGVAGAAGYAASRWFWDDPVAPRRAPDAGPFGRPVPDPGGVIDLPPGFQYRVLSEPDRRIAAGAPLPKDPDGMAAFQGPGDTTILVRNHEIAAHEGPAVEGSSPYRSDQLGGTTAVVVGPDRTNEGEYVLSSGTDRNCAGGATPWGTWLTCEEAFSDDHGYVFEIDPLDPENDLGRTPIRAMGHFAHEAIAVDPTTGVVYLTEDDFHGIVDLEDPAADTRVSYFYRYVPDDPSRRPGALHQGGRLQAMAISDKRSDGDFLSSTRRYSVRWIDVDPEEWHGASLGSAAAFTRLEGCCYADGTVFFADTMGGPERLGRIFRYSPRTETLELFHEGGDADAMESPDNLTVAPWGDLWFAEDETIPTGDDVNRIVGLAPDGSVYDFATNRLGRQEFTGPTFSPDGQTFFVNIQESRLTLAIWGPWEKAALRSQGGSIASMVVPAAYGGLRRPV